MTYANYAAYDWSTLRSFQDHKYVPTTVPHLVTQMLPPVSVCPVLTDSAPTADSASPQETCDVKDLKTPNSMTSR